MPATLVPSDPAGADRLLGDGIEALHQGSKCFISTAFSRVDPEAAQQLLRTVPLRRRRLATLAVVGVVVTPRGFGEEVAREPTAELPSILCVVCISHRT